MRAREYSIVVYNVHNCYTTYCKCFYENFSQSLQEPLMLYTHTTKESIVHIIVYKNKIKSHLNTKDELTLWRGARDFYYSPSGKCIALFYLKNIKSAQQVLFGNSLAIIIPARAGFLNNNTHSQLKNRHKLERDGVYCLGVYQ